MVVTLNLGLGIGAVVIAAIAFAFWCGGLSNSNRSAHHRIDNLEKALQKALEQIEKSVKEGWRQCPLAMQAAHKKANE